MNAQDTMSLSKESIYAEMEKAILKGTEFNNSLEFLNASGLLQVHFPMVAALVGSKHHTEHHMEGDVWEHTKQVASEIMKNDMSKDEKIKLFFSALFHDVGKPATLNWDNKKQNWTNYKHAAVGAEMVAEFLKTSAIPKRFHEGIVNLIKDHMIDVKMSDKAILKKAEELKGTSWKELMMLRCADSTGRTCSKGLAGLNERIQENQELIERITSLGVLNGKLPEVIQGRDLISLGLKPGKDIGKLLQEIRDLQIANQINTHEQAIAHAIKRIKNILEKDAQ